MRYNPLRFWGKWNQSPWHVIATEWAPFAECRAERPALENTRLIKGLALKVGANLVGMVKTQPEWIFQKYTFDYEWILMLGIAMAHEKLATAPESSR